MLSTNFFNFWLIIVIIFIAKISCKNIASVYRVEPNTYQQLDDLRESLRKLINVSCWSCPDKLNQEYDLLVPEDQNEEFEHLMDTKNLQYKVVMSDLQHFLNNSQYVIEPHKLRSLDYKLTWTRFHNLREIYYWMNTLEKKYPGYVSVVIAGYTVNKNAIKGIRLKFGNHNKKAIFIEAGIHAREWLSHATATYLINELLTSPRQDVRFLANSYEWYIFPCVNPDGYEFTHLMPNLREYRLWRKTRSHPVGKKCFNQSINSINDCYGVDPNRNFEFHWGVSGSSNSLADPCSEVYAGKYAFSEAETASLANYINKIGHKLIAYISFHTYGQKLMFPYGIATDRVENYEQQYNVGLDAIKALSRRYGTRYQIGNIAEMVGEATGSSIDWVKRNYRVPFAYCYEMRGKTSLGDFYGFVAPPSEIIPNADEIVDSLVALFQSVA